MTIQGKVQSLTKKRDGFKVNDKWYSIAEGVPLPNRDDVIAFEPVQWFNAQKNRNEEWVTSPVQVIEKAPPYQGGGSKGGGKGNYDNLGQQIGNALTNAVTLMVHGKIPKVDGEDMYTAIGNAALRLAMASDAVRAALEATKAAATPAQSAPPQAAPQPQTAPVAPTTSPPPSQPPAPSAGGPVGPQPPAAPAAPVAPPPVEAPNDKIPW